MALGLPAAARLRQIPKSHEPETLARLGAAADEAAFRAATAADRNAHFLEAFQLFAAAAARAQDEGWPEEAWSGWRHRRASLARLLASAGMMAEVSDVYERIRGQSAPRTPSVWERVRVRIGAD